jgi:hypothetical protein
MEVDKYCDIRNIIAMPRNRTIQPNFARAPNITRLSRDARLLFILLWTQADDSGRLRLDAERLREELYPLDPDAELLLPGWLDELERQRCIERYEVEGAAYLRVIGWKRLQKVQHPTASGLPAAPHEAHEPHEDRPKSQQRRASGANPHESAFFEEQESLLDEKGEVTSERVLSLLDRALRQSLKSDVHTAPARYIELAGRKAGLWGGRGAPTGRKETVPSAGPSLAELFSPEERGEERAEELGRERGETG